MDTSHVVPTRNMFPIFRMFQSMAGRGLLAGLLLSALLVQPRVARSADDADEMAIPLRPVTPGTIRVQLRSRTDEKIETGLGFAAEIKTEEWEAAETAIIICDMWDNLYCDMAAQRVDMLAPIMNQVVTQARARGVTIIHGPSGTVNMYEDTQFRKRIKQIPAVKPPIPIKGWCYLDKEKEPDMPVDTTKSACDDPIANAYVAKYTRQHPAIKITGYDAVSDSGEEIYSYLKTLGIKNVVVMGVHTNMCVLGRSFGIRQMKYLGFNVALARDLTDAMYDPREAPFVSHTRGTELVVEHIEKYWCPSLLGEDLTNVIPGSDDPVKKTEKPEEAQTTSTE